MSDSIKDVASDLNDLIQEMMMDLSVEGKIRRKQTINFADRMELIVKRLTALGKK